MTRSPIPWPAIVAGALLLPLASIAVASAHGPGEDDPGAAPGDDPSTTPSDAPPATGPEAEEAPEDGHADHAGHAEGADHGHAEHDAHDHPDHAEHDHPEHEAHAHGSSDHEHDEAHDEDAEVEDPGNAVRVDDPTREDDLASYEDDGLGRGTSVSVLGQRLVG